MSLDAEEFIRRFLLHVLPKRFVRIRHYGLMAGRNVDTRLARCRGLLENARESTSPSAPSPLIPLSLDHDPTTCPRCRGPLQRRLLVVGNGVVLHVGPQHIPVRSVAILNSS